MFGQDHQSNTTDNASMDQSVVAAASSYEEASSGAPAGATPSVISPTTPPPPPLLSGDPVTTNTAPALSLPSIQPTVPVTVPRPEILKSPSVTEIASSVVSENTPSAETVLSKGSVAGGTPAVQPSPTANDLSYPEPSTPSKPAAEGIEDLFVIKQDALHDLSPLVDHLEQTPEEKFRTLMMMIQASDDQELVRPAYEAAHAIVDDKVRAQALLDIVNEINYFTQHQTQES